MIDKLKAIRDRLINEIYACVDPNKESELMDSLKEINKLIQHYKSK
ncbi:hypothetical protein MUP95_10475 [bacterium]|nr:hypothetical protein [bacterium]